MRVPLPHRRVTGRAEWFRRLSRVWARWFGLKVLAIELADAIVAVTLFDIITSGLLGWILVARGTDSFSRSIGLVFFALSAVSLVLSFDAWVLVRDLWRRSRHQ